MRVDGRSTGVAGDDLGSASARFEGTPARVRRIQIRERSRRERQLERQFSEWQRRAAVPAMT